MQKKRSSEISSRSPYIMISGNCNKKMSICFVFWANLEIERLSYLNLSTRNLVILCNLMVLCIWDAMDSTVPTYPQNLDNE